MNKIKTFFRTLWLSTTSPRYYGDVLQAPASFSWQYFLVLNALFSLVITVLVSIPVAMFNVQRVADEVVKVYPQDLEVRVENGRLAINQELPYSIAFPREWTGTMPREAKREMDLNDIPMERAEEMNLVTFESDENIGNIQDFYATNSLIVLTQSTAYILKDVDTGEVRSYPIPQTEQPMVLSSDMIAMGKRAFLEMPMVKYKWYVPVVALVLWPFIMVGMTLWRMLTLVVYTAVVWLIAKMFMKAQVLSYGKLYQVGLHALTPIILLAVVVNRFSHELIQGWIYFIAYVAWTLFCLSQVQAKSTVTATKMSKPRVAATKTKSTKKRK